MASTDTKTAASPMAAAATPPNRGLGMTVMMDVGIVEHDLAASAQLAAVVGLAFDENVD